MIIMKRKFDILFEDILQDINASYVDYELFSVWQKRITKELKSLLNNKEQAKLFVKAELDKYDKNGEIDKRKEILHIYQVLFNEPLI